VRAVTLMIGRPGRRRAAETSRNKRNQLAAAIAVRQRRTEDGPRASKVDRGGAFEAARWNI